MSKAEVSLEELIYMDSDEYTSTKNLMQNPTVISSDSYFWTQNPLKLKYAKLLNHLDSVSYGCRKLAFALIDEGNEKLAHELIIEGLTHDLSKLYGIEFEYLCDYDKHKGSPMLKEAILEHVHNNTHHPEYLGYDNGIHSMDDLAIAVLVVDWHSRGVEFGKSIRRFLEEEAFEKYGFDEQSAVFQKMNYFYKLLTGKNI